MTAGKPIEDLTRAEAIRELEAELAKPILPPSDWREQVQAQLAKARRILAESPMGRGRI